MTATITELVAAAEHSPLDIARSLAGTTFTLLTAAASNGNRHVGKANTLGGHGCVGAGAHRVRLQILQDTPRVLRDLTATLRVRVPPLGGGDPGIRRAIIAVGHLAERAQENGHTEAAEKATRYLARARDAAQAATGEARLRPYVWRAHDNQEN